MSELLRRSGAGATLALLSPAALAAQEEVLEAVGKAGLYVLIAVLVIVAAFVYFRNAWDKRTTPLNDLLEERETIHAVAPDTAITECVRRMTAEKIGALIVMEGEKLVGIFTERDALAKVLAAGRDPASTRVSEVMTKDPTCIAPATSVGEAMELVTRRRFRHLPVVENGRVLAVISSGDLTHWLVKDQVGEVQQLVDLAARS